MSSLKSRIFQPKSSNTQPQPSISDIISDILGYSELVYKDCNDTDFWRMIEKMDINTKKTLNEKMLEIYNKLSDDDKKKINVDSNVSKEILEKLENERDAKKNEYDKYTTQGKTCIEELNEYLQTTYFTKDLEEIINEIIDEYNIDNEIIDEYNIDKDFNKLINKIFEILIQNIFDNKKLIKNIFDIAKITNETRKSQIENVLKNILIYNQKEIKTELQNMNIIDDITKIIEFLLNIKYNKDMATQNFIARNTTDFAYQIYKLECKRILNYMNNLLNPTN